METSKTFGVGVSPTLFLWTLKLHLQKCVDLFHVELILVETLILHMQHCVLVEPISVDTNLVEPIMGVLPGCCLAKQASWRGGESRNLGKRLWESLFSPSTSVIL